MHTSVFVGFKATSLLFADKREMFVPNTNTHTQDINTMVMDLLIEPFFDRINWKTIDGKQTISLNLGDQHAQIEIPDDLSGMYVTVSTLSSFASILSSKIRSFHIVLLQSDPLFCVPPDLCTCGPWVRAL